MEPPAMWCVGGGGGGRQGCGVTGRGETKMRQPSVAEWEGGLLKCGSAPTVSWDGGWGSEGGVGGVSSSVHERECVWECIGVGVCVGGVACVRVGL